MFKIKPQFSKNKLKKIIQKIDSSSKMKNFNIYTNLKSFIRFDILILRLYAEPNLFLTFLLFFN